MMHMTILEIGRTYYFLVAPLLAWFLAQLLKVILTACLHQRLSLERMVGSGGFPSSHSALVMALTTALAIKEGLASSSFAIALIFALIVMYDASGVRRAAGRQAQILNELIRHFKARKIEISQDGSLLKELLGHTPYEVLGGFILGILVAIGLDCLLW